MSSELNGVASRVLPRRKKPTVPFFWPEWIIQREIAARVRLALKEAGRGRLLDVGCGEKPYRVYRPPHVTHWVGFDVPENPAADIHGHAEALPFEAQTFETVLCTEVLEHVKDPALVLREVHRVLCAGGHVILTTPFYWPLHEEPFDFFRFSPYALRHLFSEADLEIVRIEPLAVGFRMVALAVNTCFNNFGKRLPGGNTIPIKSLFIPIYVVVNLAAYMMSMIFPSNNNAVGTAVLARRRH